MSTPVRVAAFLAALVAAFLAAWSVGHAVDPIDTEPVAHSDGHGDEHGESHLPGGLMVSQDGYTLVADQRARSGRQVPLTFSIIGPDGHPVTGFDVQHEKQLHLIAVRRDFSRFQHVHPTMDADGTWSVALDLAPGPWRLFADFKPTGADALTLGTDLSVAGSYRPAKASADARVDHVDGYTVRLDGDLAAGEDSLLMLVVEKDGQLLTTEPYLGAAGHLVVLREGDLAYLHVHPEKTDSLLFEAAVPSAGTYHLYLDFKLDGVVRTAQFVLTTGAGHDH